MSNPSYSIASDGGGDGVTTGAAAAIFVDRARARKYKAVVLLGPADGAQAEIVGGILALLLLESKGPTGPAAIPWFTDSQYLIRSAGGAETRLESRNDPLLRVWKALPLLGAVEPRYVRARSGHRMNESCDRACRWIQRSGEKLLRATGEGPIGAAPKRESGECWYLIDAREVFAQMRAGVDGDVALEGLRRKINQTL